MMLECSPGDLLAMAAFMHHDDQGHDALIQLAVLKGLTGVLFINRSIFLNIPRSENISILNRKEVTVILQCIQSYEWYEQVE